MFAIVEIAGKQVKVSPDQVVAVPKIEGNVGDEVHCDKVLMIEKDSALSLGYPYVDTASISARIFAQDRGKKHFARVYKRRKQYKKAWGYRTPFTLLKVSAING